MIYRGCLAICSDAGRCSDVRGRQIPRIHRDFGARVNLPDPLGTGGGTHGRGFHHRWPHPVCLVLAGPRNEIHARKRKAGRQARTHRGLSRGEQAKAHWPPLPPVLSICLSLLLFSPFHGGKTRVKQKENREIVPGPDGWTRGGPVTVALTTQRPRRLSPRSVPSLERTSSRFADLPRPPCPTLAPTWYVHETRLDSPSTREVSPRAVASLGAGCNVGRRQFHSLV